MAQLTATQSAVAARFLRDASDSLSDNSCNDFYLENTPDNLLFAREMIAASDYPDEEPRIVRNGTKIYVKDWIVASYLADLLERE